jgi:hypothetical protein
MQKLISNNGSLKNKTIPHLTFAEAYIQLKKYALGLVTICGHTQFFYQQGLPTCTL